MQDENRNDAITGLELIIAIAVICIFIWLCGSIVFNAVMPHFNNSSGPRGGFVGFATGESADILIIDGTCFGAQNTGGDFLGVELSAKDNTGPEMGSCTIPLRLYSYQQVSIEISNAKILFSYNGKTEELSYSDKRPLVSPSWTIAQKSNIIPLANADSDIILEPNEIFTILVYPEESVPAEKKFSVVVTPQSYNPLSINTAVPPEIVSQRIVELYV